MTEPRVTLAGRPALSCRGFVPYGGAWTADVDFAERFAPADLGAGVLELKVGATVLRGAVDLRRSGAFQEVTRVALVGGAGGWGRVLPPRAYHNDSGVRPSLVAQDAAREASETVVLEAGVDDTPGRPAGGVLAVDWLRAEAPAARALEQMFPGVPWWVDLAGVTHLGARPEAAAAGVELLNLDPETLVATLSLAPGATIAGALPGTRVTDARRGVDVVVQDLGFDATGTLEARCVPAGDVPRESQVRTELRALVASLFPHLQLSGLFRYRVARQLEERVELQAVRLLPGLPDTLALPIHPGVPGAKALLEGGTIVLVQFVESSPAFPVVTHFQRADGERFVPLELELAAQDAMGFVLGRDTETAPTSNGRPVCYGDAVSVVGGSPAAGTIQPTGPSWKGTFS